MKFTLDFLKLFFSGLYLGAPLLLSLMLVVILLGQRVGRIEKWTRFEALYWSFITATTVGYGDFRPTRKRSRFLAVMIAFIGLIFTGIIVAIALQAATAAFTSYQEFKALKANIGAITK